MDNIPVIDLASYLNGSDKQSVAAEIGRSCIDIGFFTIKNHGIPLDVIHAANNAAAAFFDQSAEIKQQSVVANGMGYIASGGENLAASLDEAQVTDIKESLNLTLPVSSPIWPAGVDGAFSAEAKPYFDALIDLSKTLMRLFALALDLPETWFDDKTDDPRTILRLLNYPAVSAIGPNPTRAGAHTDYGTLTILWSPDSRGLQAQNRAGDWVDVVAPSDHLIINIGDLMMNWTNDRWISTLHRVMRHPDTAGKRRQSIAFFHNPNADALIECIESCRDAGTPAKYAPILAKAHLEMKITKALGQDVKL